MRFRADCWSSGAGGKHYQPDPDIEGEWITLSGTPNSPGDPGWYRVHRAGTAALERFGGRLVDGCWVLVAPSAPTKWTNMALPWTCYRDGVRFFVHFISPDDVMAIAPGDDPDFDALPEVKP